MADYWIKLYLEILDDPKMGTLPDRLWRRVIELFLLAGRVDGVQKTGILPNTIQLAWMLRMPSDDLQLDLDQIASTGIIEPVANGWFIPKFEQRQAAASPAERKAAQRDREHKEQYDGNVTNLSRKVTQKQNRTETEQKQNRTEQKPPPPNVFSLYEAEIGALTPMVAEDLKDAETEYTPAWVMDAIREAVKNNARNWKYTLAILKRWKKDGRIDKRENNNSHKQEQSAGVMRIGPDGEEKWFPY